MAYFRADFVAELKKKVEVEVDRLLDAMQAQGPVVDMVEMFSAELPLFTLCEILGVPAADRRSWSTGCTSSKPRNTRRSRKASAM